MQMTQKRGRILRGLRGVFQSHRGGAGTTGFTPVPLPDDGQEFLKPTAAMLEIDLRPARSGHTQALEYFRRAEAMDGEWRYREALDAYGAARQAAESPLLLMAYGVASIMASDLAQAATAFCDGIDVAEARRNSGLAIALRINLGQVYSDLGDGCRSKQVLEEARSLSHSTGKQNFEQTCHLRLGHLCFIHGVYDEADGHCDEVLQGSPLDQNTRAKALYLKAVISMVGGDLDATDASLELGATSAEGATPSFVLVRLKAHLASLCQLRGQVAAARMAAEDALSWSRRLGNRHGEARCMTLLTAIDQFAGGTDDQPFRESHELDRQLGYERGIARSHLERSRIHLLRGQLEEARAAVWIAVKAATMSGHRALYLETASSLTALSADIDDDDKMVRLNQFAAASRSTPLPSVEISILQHLGSVNLAAGRIAEAIQVYEAALRRSEEIGMQLGQSQILATLDRLAEQQGQGEAATQYRQRADLVLPDAS